MTCEEFSSEFDVLLDSYRRFKNFDDKEFLDSLDFNEYEKSLFLTKAQEDIIIKLYNGKNPYTDSFEKTEELRRYLSGLVKTVIIEERELFDTGVSSNSVFFKLPEDLMFITLESVKLSDESECLNGKSIAVIPITQDDWHRIKNNPFRQPNTRKALRLDIDNHCVEIISSYPISQYFVRYVSKPTPIMLIDSDEVSIDGVSQKTECMVHPALHRMILEEAVRLAASSKSLSSNNNTKEDK